MLIPLVQAKYTILIGGGTGAGKTTMLNALSAFIPGDERIITIEDNAELQIQGIPNLVRLECRAANIEESQEISMADLLKTALRMRPDRIIGIYGATTPIIPCFRYLLQSLYNSCRKASV